MPRLRRAVERFEAWGGVYTLICLALLPRSRKTLILIAVDAVIVGMAFWLSVLVRTGFIPRMPDHYLVGATALAMLVVPAAGITFGLYRPVIRFHIPFVAARRLSVSLRLTASPWRSRPQKNLVETT